MFRSPAGKVTPGMALRVFADALMIQFSLLMALSLTLFYHLLAGGLPLAKSLSQHFWVMLGQYTEAAWPLTLICIALFYLSGFYTYGRFYQGRYKALIVFQAVSQSYLIFGFVTYFIQGELSLPRTALIMSWALSVVMLAGARLWLHIWKKIADPERDRLLSQRKP